MDFRDQQSRRRMMVLMDALIIGLSMFFAAITHGALRSRFSWFKDPPAIEQYLLVAALTIPMMLGLSLLFGLHRHTEYSFQASRVVADQTKLVLTSLLGITLIIFLTQVPLNRSVVALFLGYIFALTIAARFVLHRWRLYRHASRHSRHHLLLIGTETSLVERIIDSARTEDLPPHFVGVISAPGLAPADNVAFVKVLGGLETLRRVLHEETIDEVVLATRGLSAKQFADVLEACDDLGTPIRQIVLPDIHDGRRMGLEREYGLPFVTLSRAERSMEALALKRLIDIVGSSVGLITLAPVMLRDCRRDYADDGQPVFFSQEAIGYRGRRFQMHKFRSMVKGAEQQRHALSNLNELDGQRSRSPTTRVSRASVDSCASLVSMNFRSSTMCLSET